MNDKGFELFIVGGFCFFILRVFWLDGKLEEVIFKIGCWILECLIDKEEY